MSYKEKYKTPAPYWVCRNLFTYILLMLFVAANYSCQEDAGIIQNVYTYTRPDYGQIQLHISSDTISFPLSENAYNAIKSFDLFLQGKKEYIAFYDRHSESINFYDWESKRLKKQLLVKTLFSGKKLYKGAIYVKNFDSIFIANDRTLYMADSAGNKKKIINFVEDPYTFWANFDQTTPPVFKNGKLYTGVRSTTKVRKLKDAKKWKVLYEFDINAPKAALFYPLPSMYHKNEYGYPFLDYSYCVNDKGNFVFSFPADTSVYESNLGEYNHAYNARSQYQKNDILPLSDKSIVRNEDFKEYAIRDSYGTIYFDPGRKYYLRFAKQRMSESDYLEKKQTRKQSILIMDRNFKIVGETELPNGIYFDYLFFAPDGNLYIRVNPNNEYALQFVRLDYTYKNEARL